MVTLVLSAGTVQHCSVRGTQHNFSITFLTYQRKMRKVAKKVGFLCEVISVLKHLKETRYNVNSVFNVENRKDNKSTLLTISNEGYI